MYVSQIVYCGSGLDTHEGTVVYPDRDLLEDVVDSNSLLNHLAIVVVLRLSIGLLIYETRAGRENIYAREPTALSTVHPLFSTTRSHSNALKTD
jgi:hypothetical protein